MMRYVMAKLSFRRQELVWVALGTFDQTKVEVFPSEGKIMASALCWDARGLIPIDYILK